MFTRETGNSSRKGGVFQIKRGGEGLRRMLSRRFSHADWSPVNGKLVTVRLLTEQYQDYYQIVTMRPDGSGKRVLTSKNQVSLEPRWSPDGQQIVYQLPDFRADGRDEATAGLVQPQPLLVAQGRDAHASQPAVNDRV